MDSNNPQINMFNATVPAEVYYWTERCTRQVRNVAKRLMPQKVYEIIQASKVRLQHGDGP